MAFTNKENDLKPGYEMQYTTIKIRIYPDEKQTDAIEKTFNCCRFLWNQMLLDQQEFYAATDRHYIPRSASYKKNFPFLKEADSFTLNYVYRDLANAFSNFFSIRNNLGVRFLRKRRTANGHTQHTATIIMENLPTVFE